MRVAIALGSNLGDKLGYIRKGFDFLRGLSSGETVLSGIYLTAPENCPPGSDDFYNAVVLIEWPRTLEELLDQCMAFEVTLGRPLERPKNMPRSLDLDLLLAEDRVIQTERLTIPHPLMLQRIFVLEPLAEIVPQLILPQSGNTVEHHLLELKQSGKAGECHKIV